MKLRAFVSTPYQGIKAACPAAPSHLIRQMARDLALKACRQVRRELGYLPFSPVLAYGDVYDEFGAEGEAERAEVMALCLADLAGADVLVQGLCPPYSDNSEGMSQELSAACDKGLRVEEITIY